MTLIRFVSGRVMEVEGVDRAGLTASLGAALRSQVPWSVFGVTINPFCVEMIEDKPS